MDTGINSNSNLIKSSRNTINQVVHTYYDGHKVGYNGQKRQLNGEGDNKPVHNNSVAEASFRKKESKSSQNQHLTSPSTIEYAVTSDIKSNLPPADQFTPSSSDIRISSLLPKFKLGQFIHFQSKSSPVFLYE